MSFVYILTNASNTVLYIGVTNNLVRRVWEHKNKVVAGFTSQYQLNKLVYYECYTDIYNAIQREKVLKFWKRAWKERLINQSNPEWKDLYQEICL
ncbi:MAG: GIY-YIG nuclease family protein [Elusimicrobia bacterium]|nr:GIY-YIG nuclease family protein [Elusimicrobiota bacterium]